MGGGLGFFPVARLAPFHTLSPSFKMQIIFLHPDCVDGHSAPSTLIIPMKKSVLSLIIALIGIAFMASCTQQGGTSATSTTAATGQTSTPGGANRGRRVPTTAQSGAGSTVRKKQAKAKASPSPSPSEAASPSPTPYKREDRKRGGRRWVTSQSIDRAVD